MNKIIAFLIETRAGILFTTILPAMIGAAAAHRAAGHFSLSVFLTATACFVFIHLGTNVINDFFDDKDGTDRVNKVDIGPFAGGSRLLQKKVLSPNEVLAEAVTLFIIAGVFLAIASVFAGWVMAAAGVFAMASGIFYSAPPLKISRTGFGEFFVFLNLGPVVMLASYFIQTKTLNPAFIPVSLMPGLLTAAFVVAAGFPDYKADKNTGKNNLVVRLGLEKARILYIAMCVVAYLAIVPGVLTGVLPTAVFAALAGAPLSMLAAFELWEKYKEPTRLGPACGFTLIAHLLACLGLLYAFII